MHPTEAQFIQVAQRYAVVGMQAAKAYNEEQAKLGLEIVLSQSRLENSQGTKLSLATLEWLSALTSAHRDAFKKVVLAFSAELSAVMAEMPDHLCDDYRSRIAAIVQWQLSAQSEFYSNRETLDCRRHRDLRAD